MYSLETTYLDEDTLPLTVTLAVLHTQHVCTDFLFNFGVYVYQTAHNYGKISNTTLQTMDTLVHRPLSFIQGMTIIGVFWLSHLPLSLIQFSTLFTYHRITF